MNIINKNKKITYWFKESWFLVVGAIGGLILGLLICNFIK